MKAKLLVAEDHPSMRAMVVSLLQRDFDVVASVANGEAAVEAASKFMPDVIVLDVSMPILDGPDAARRLRAQGCDGKLVFLSLFADLDQVNVCLAAGGNAYVSKLQMASDLVRAVHAVLAGKTFVSAARY